MVDSESGDLAMKGFTTTLEAIIGSILLLSSVTIITGTLQPGTEAGRFSAPINTEISRKIDNISIKSAETEIDPVLPDNYRHSAFIRDTDTKEILLEPEGGVDSHYVNLTGSTVFLHLFPQSSNYEISYRGREIFKGRAPSYREFKSSNTSGFINVTGDAAVRVEAVNQSIVGEPRTGGNINSYNFPKYDGSPAEVKISVWR